MSISSRAAREPDDADAQVPAADGGGRGTKVGRRRMAPPLLPG